MTTQQTLSKPEPKEVTRRQGQERYFQPATDIVETADAVVLTCDMPGVSRENVDITVDKDALTIAGTAEPEEAGRPAYRETYVGDYRRQFTLSSDLDANNVTATMDNGVLTVTVGKAERTRPRKIEIATR